jgi:hypothetical protein
MDHLLDHQRQQSLVSFRRAAIDEFTMQGFVIGVSDQLLLLQYIYDFHLDGLMILRTGDISEVVRTKTDEFQEQLLEAEGLRSRVPFDYRIDLSSWPAAITGLCKDYPLLILERELLEEPDLAIGRILAVDDEEVSLRYFTGAANWLDEPDRLRTADITCCQAGTNYINVYQRHFARSPTPSSP